MSEVLKLIDVEKVYPNGTHALRGVNIEVKTGEFIGIMGPSGSGKSTLLHLSAGLDKPTRGQIFLLGTRIDRMSQKELSRYRKGRVAFIFQFPYLLEDFNVLENLTVVGQILGVKDVKDKALDILEYLRLSHRKGHRPSQLSGGEQQRVAIGRALMTEPKIIFADEPTGSVDMQEGRKIFDLFLKLRQDRGITFLIATHNQEISKYFDRVIHMLDGKVV